MKRNVGGFDRVVRLVLGSALVVAAVVSLLGYTPLDTVLIVAAIALGAVLIATGILGFCPLFVLLGLDSVRRGDARP